MTPLALAGTGLTAVFTALLLAAERRHSLRGRALTKPVASLGFLIAAATGALDMKRRNGAFIQPRAMVGIGG